MKTLDVVPRHRGSLEQCAGQTKICRAYKEGTGKETIENVLKTVTFSQTLMNTANFADPVPRRKIPDQPGWNSRGQKRRNFKPI
jgi:hypothetical protein